MKRFLPLFMLASVGLAQIQINIEIPPPAIITITTAFQIALMPSLVVIERDPEPQGIVVVYRSNRPYDVYTYHDRDLERRGWVRVGYRARGGGYESEYRRGRARARLEVEDRHGRVRVKVHEE